MAISVQMTIPSSSDYYTTGGDQTVTLAGVDEVVVHSKKELIKVQKAKSKSRADTLDSDQFDNSVVDLKKGTDEIVVKGWIDDDTDTAWEKFWRLRAMVSRGGPLTNFTLENIQFKSTTQEAFLEEVTASIKADDTSAINTKFAGIARINLSLKFFIGDER